MNFCFTFKGQAAISLLPTPLFWFSRPLASHACARARAEDGVKRTSPILPPWPLGGVGWGSGAPTAGLGESVFASAILGQGTTGPLALFSFSCNTIEVLLRLRERLQSALL